MIKESVKEFILSRTINGALLFIGPTLEPRDLASEYLSFLSLFCRCNTIINDKPNRMALHEMATVYAILAISKNPNDIQNYESIIKSSVEKDWIDQENHRIVDYPAICNCLMEKSGEIYRDLRNYFGNKPLEARIQEIDNYMNDVMAIMIFVCENTQES